MEGASVLKEGTLNTNASTSEPCGRLRDIEKFWEEREHDESC
jgi:hypothetical protein